jgi:hypothetical protein
LRRFHLAAVSLAAIGLTLGLSACSGTSSKQAGTTPRVAANSATATRSGHGAYPKLDPFVGNWATQCPDGGTTLSIDQKHYAGKISDGTTTTDVFLETIAGPDGQVNQPALAFTRKFNDQFPEAKDAPLELKGQQLIITGDGGTLALNPC